MYMPAISVAIKAEDVGIDDTIRITPKRATILAKLRVAMMPVTPRPAITKLVEILTEGASSSSAHRGDLHMKARYHSQTHSLSFSTRKGTVTAEQRDGALELAIAALGYIAGAPEELSRFLALTGIAPDAIRAAAAEPGFLGGVLGYIAGNERMLLAFAAQSGIAPEEVEKAWTVLAGADWEREVP